MNKMLAYLLLLLMMISISSCALFRKKNRCDDCPKWSSVDNVGKSKNGQNPLKAVLLSFGSSDYFVEDFMNSTLDNIKAGLDVVIVAFNDQLVEEKMMEMGCLVGDKISVLKRAPLGDPLFIQTEHSQIGLRESEAMVIEVQSL